MSSPPYTDLPERAVQAIRGAIPSPAMVVGGLSRFAEVQPRAADTNGATEIFDGVTFTHYRAELPGDYDSINWHYVECGLGEPIVFLHGIPDSWYQWHHQMAALATTHHCIAVDLKGYGQSYNGPGDYRPEGAAERWPFCQSPMSTCSG